MSSYLENAEVIKASESANELFGYMEVLPVAFASIMPSGGFRFANGAARALLELSRQTRVDFHGKLVVRMDSELHDAIEAKRPRATFKKLGPLACPETVALFFGDQGSDTLLLALRKSTEYLPGRRLPDFFGLTVAERAVLNGLVSGDSISTIAIQRNTSEHTIRTQLKSIFRKTKTHRQAELVCLFSSFAHM